MPEWVQACSEGDVAPEEVIRFDHGGRTFAVYRSPEDDYFATDGLCTHEKVHLADGLVMEDTIECPKHNGRFDYKTGQAKGAPVCVNLQTYPVRRENGVVLIEIRGRMSLVRGMVVVGAGEAGTRAALSLREAGYKGRITLLGEEPHLPYERPPLSKSGMAADALPELKIISTRAQFASAAIEFLNSARAAGIDPARRTVLLTDGAVLPYDKLLLSTGAVPRRLPRADTARHCVYLRTYDDALAIRRRLGPTSRVAIIGGGFIGLELAASARDRGANVIVIESQPRILMRGVPAEIAAVLHARHEAAGVEILCGESVTGIAEDGETVLLMLSSGKAVAADLAVIGVGAAPATGLAETAGLAIDNGIAVDPCLRSSDPHIYAAGDCCSFPLTLYGGRRVRLEAWRSAQEQGVHAARNMLGAGEAYAAVPWFWSDQHDLGLQIAGLPDEGCSILRRDLGNGAFILFHLAADGRLVAASGIGPGNAVARDIRIAEMLIARRFMAAKGDLARPELRLKSLLAA